MYQGVEGSLLFRGLHNIKLYYEIALGFEWSRSALGWGDNLVAKRAELKHSCGHQRH